MSLHALVVDADDLQRDVVRVALSPDGWTVCEARSLAEAEEVIGRHQPALVFCEMGERDEAACLLRELMSKVGRSVPIIMMSASATARQVIEAMINGAYDLLDKPCRETDIRARARIVMERSHEAEKDAEIRLRTVAHGESGMSVAKEFDIIGRSVAIRAATSELAKALRDDHLRRTAGERQGTTPRPPTFLVTGETGTGKELVARAIHAHSRYAGGPFIAVNCGNLHAELADAQLFGSSPGAFTGAVRHEQAGLWEGAAGGTLFLDEITEAPAAVWSKMLRVLQFGEFTRLGSKRMIKVDVQVVAATNRDVCAEIQAGRFREDLYHRLSLYRIHVPPLRERLDDVPPLVEHFAKVYGSGRVRFSRDATELLQTYKWRGNVRELENVIRAAVNASLDCTVYTADLLPLLATRREFRTTGDAYSSAGGPVTEAHVTPQPPQARVLDDRVREFKLETIRETLAHFNGNVTRSAQALGISRASLYKLLKAPSLIDQSDQVPGTKTGG